MVKLVRCVVFVLFLRCIDFLRLRVDLLTCRFTLTWLNVMVRMWRGLCLIGLGLVILWCVLVSRLIGLRLRYRVSVSALVLCVCRLCGWNGRRRRN